MKTSNKLLLAPIGLFLLFVLTGMVYLKTSLVPRGIGDGDQLIQGEGSLQKKEIQVSSFDKVLAGQGMEYQLVKGTGQVEIEAEANLLPYIEPSVEDGQLSIGVKEGYSLRESQEKSITITIGFQDLQALTIRDGAIVEVKDTIQSTDFRGQIHSAGEGTLLVNATNVFLEVHSGSNLKVGGNCTNLDARINSAAELQAFDLVCTNAKVNTHSAANARVHVTGTLNASAHSAAEVLYRGNPAKVHSSAHSAGRVHAD